MDENLHSKLREPTRQQFISLGGVVGLLLRARKISGKRISRGKTRKVWAWQIQYGQTTVKSECLRGNAWLITLVNANFIPRSGRGPGKLADVQCYNCGEYGHISKNCGQRANAACQQEYYEQDSWDYGNNEYYDGEMYLSMYR